MLCLFLGKSSKKIVQEKLRGEWIGVNCKVSKAIFVIWFFIQYFVLTTGYQTALSMGSNSDNERFFDE